VEDEHRYGLISFIRRCWMLRGHRCTAPYQTKYEWAYVYAAAEIVTGNLQVLYTPTVSLDWTEVFLSQIVHTDPQAVHVVLWDQAGYHPSSGHPTVPKQVYLFPFAPYCPELNPIEKLWNPVKERLGNEAWDTLDQAQDAITEVLQPFWEQPHPVYSLLGNGWLIQGVVTLLEKNSLIIT